MPTCPIGERFAAIDFSLLRCLEVERPGSLGVLYWERLAAMFGIPRFDYVFAGGLDIDPAKAPELLEAACGKARALGRRF